MSVVGARLGFVLHCSKLIRRSNSPYLGSKKSLLQLFCTESFERSPVQCSRPNYLMLSEALTEDDCNQISRDMVVHEDFLSEEQETSLFNEVEPYMKRLRYEFDHWDDAIHGFRETERLHWTKPNALILDHVRKAAFPPGQPQLHHVHVLDLSEDGVIKPHVDSIRFCGDTIAGLSLLSSCVMRLVHVDNKNKTVDVLLKRRSLYIMKGSARYDYTHEVLIKDLSKFKGTTVPRGRRISVICRSETSK